MKSRQSLRKMIIEELINDDAIFSNQEVPGESNQELIKKMIKHNEKDLMHPDNERNGSYMTHNQLFHICNQADYLLNNVPEGSTLEPWMETKLTIASEALDSVYKSLFSRLEK
tara:strand:- start:56 stop:394 length:339 start_codon:yes stop_codon:yes gene_type:complete